MQSITLQTSDSAITSSDILGRLNFAASAESDGGAAILQVGSIYAMAEGTFSASANPASIIFATSASDTSDAQDRLKISHEGHILPITNNAYDLGSTSLRFKSTHTNALTINNAYSFPTSDGGASQVLQTDGAGSLSFATISAGGSYTAGSGLTLVGTQFNVYGGSANFKYAELTSSNSVPTFKYLGSGVTDTPINMEVRSSFQSATGSGTALLFQGTQGQLFSITDNLSSGTIFNVSDITGLPMLEVTASGDVEIGEFADNITIHQPVLLSGGIPSSTTNKLYNDNGSLYFNGSALGGGLSNIVEDTTPQLGGNLDAQDNQITNIASMTFNSEEVAIGTSATAAGTGVSIGYLAGNSVTYPKYGVYIGHQAGYASSGSTLFLNPYNENIYIGYRTGQLSTGTNNVALGIDAAYNLTGGASIAVGGNSLKNATGDFNIEIITNGASSSIIGTNSNRIHIENTIIGNTSSKLLAIGNVTSSDLTPDATLEIKPKATTDIGLIVQAVASHSASLQEWQNSSETKLLAVGPDGGLEIPSNTPSSTTNKLYNDGSNLNFGTKVIIDSNNVNTGLQYQPLGGGLNVTGLTTTEFAAATLVTESDAISSNDNDTTIPTSAAVKDYVDGQGYATLASPTFTGTPSAPTAAAGTNTTQVATTAYVTTAISNLVDGAPTALDTLNELAAALNDDASAATTLTNLITTTSGNLRTDIDLKLENIVEDTTPQLGGTLDANGNTIDMGTYVITDAKVGQWDTAYGWGDHASAGYLTSQTSHADVVVDGDFGSQGIMLRGASAGTYSILTDNSSNWNTAYGWGDHASAGYITATLTQEQVEDYAGNLISTGGTKTGITVTYQDSTNDVDFVVGGLTTTEFAAATLVTAAEGIGSNNNDTTIPTSAAVKAYADSVAGGGGSPGGSDTQIQFNDGGSFGGDADLVWNKTTNALTITGSLNATTKSFLIDHPSKEGMKLQYASLEGPENGVYVRGTTDKGFITLPDYWRDLVHNGSITVTLTPVGQFQPLFVEQKSNREIRVGGVCGYYDYVVYGERKDVDKLEVEW